MKKYNDNLKIKNTLKIDGIIIEIFETESPIVQSTLLLKKCINKIVLLMIFFILTDFLLSKFVIFQTLSIFLFTSIILRYIFRIAGDISYTYSEKFGGKKAKFIFKKNEGVLDTLVYNLRLMQKEELKLVRNILKANYLYNIYSLKELKDYFSKSKPKKKDDVIINFLKTSLGVYIIPITLGIISTYVSISNMSLEENILNILYIVFYAMVILGILLIIYIIYTLKKFSITEVYTFRRLEKLLLELLLEENKKIEFKKSYRKKR